MRGTERAVRGTAGSAPCTVRGDDRGRRCAPAEVDRTDRILTAGPSAPRAGPRPVPRSSRSVNFPMRRTRPKTSPTGLERCSWDEALDLIAATLLECGHPPGSYWSRSTRARRGHGAHRHRALAAAAHQSLRTPNIAHDPSLRGRVTRPARTTPSDAGAADARRGAERLHRGVGLEPNGNFWTLATDIGGGQGREAPGCWSSIRAGGFGEQGGRLLQVRPGTDGALALGLIHLLIRDGVTTSNSCASGPTHVLVPGRPGMLSQAPTWTACPPPVDVTSRPSTGAPSSSSTEPSGASMRGRAVGP